MTIRECNRLHDDGIADGNLTKCSASSGCGLAGCPYTKEVHMKDKMSLHTTFKAPRDGHYMAMTVVNKIIDIHWSRHLNTGEIMAHPPAAHVLMVMSTPI